jgi:DNA-binding NarL/FixJ family response regulator
MLGRESIRILIVDDYAPWRRFLRSTLEKRADLQVIGEVSDGLDAVKQAEALQPDLILLDIGLPTLNGIEAARQIRELAPQTAILFLTQDSSPPVVEEALRLGSGYVIKVNGAELLTAIDEVLHGRKFVSSVLAKQILTTQDPDQTNPESALADSEGTFRVDMDSPLPVNLPEEEQIERILRGTFVADCNDALARMYGLSSANDLIGKRMSDMVAPDDPKNVELTRQFVRSGYRVRHRKSYEADIWGNPKVFLNTMTGVVVDGKLIATWGRQSDITGKVRPDPPPPGRGTR